jgi:hypothetical protein
MIPPNPEEGGHNETDPPASFGGPADSESPVALRPSFARGLPFRLLLICDIEPVTSRSQVKILTLHRSRSELKMLGASMTNTGPIPDAAQGPRQCDVEQSGLLLVGHLHLRWRLSSPALVHSLIDATTPSSDEVPSNDGIRAACWRPDRGPIFYCRAIWAYGDGFTAALHSKRNVKQGLRAAVCFRVHWIDTHQALARIMLRWDEIGTLGNRASDAWRRDPPVWQGVGTVAQGGRCTGRDPIYDPRTLCRSIHLTVARIRTENGRRRVSEG